MAALYPNNVSTTLAADLAASATTMTVADGSGFGTINTGDHMWVTLDSGSAVEIVRATNHISNVLVIERGQDGTTAAAFTTGDVVEVRVCRALLHDIAASNTGGTTGQGVRYWAGWSQTALANVDATTLQEAGMVETTGAPLTGNAIDIDPVSDPTPTWNAFIVVVEPHDLSSLTQSGFNVLPVWQQNSRTNVTLGLDTVNIYAVIGLLPDRTQHLIAGFS